MVIKFQIHREHLIIEKSFLLRLQKLKRNVVSIAMWRSVFSKIMGEEPTEQKEKSKSENMKQKDKAEPAKTEPQPKSRKKEAPVPPEKIVQDTIDHIKRKLTNISDAVFNEIQTTEGTVTPRQR